MSNHISLHVSNFISLPGNPPYNHFKTHQFPVHPSFLLPLQGGGVHKILGKTRDPSQARFQGGTVIVNIISVEAKTHFQAKRIPCTKTRRLYSQRRACFRSEERRVGKECVRPCNSRLSSEHS